MAAASSAPTDFFDFESKEPWAPDTSMIVPLQPTQILVPENAVILGAQAFLKIARLPYTIRECYNAADISPNGKLPVVKSGAFVVSELDGIVQLAQAKGVNVTDYLNAAERADLRAYMSLVNNVLGNAFLYFTWLDDNVYNNYTKERVGSPYNFPLKYLLPWTMKRKMKAQLNALKWGYRTPEEVYSEVDTCLLALTERLGDADYFFGKAPTELDALVFGYLFTMLTHPLHSHSQLCNLVKQHPTLTKFVVKFETEFFKEDRMRQYDLELSGDES